MDTCRYKFRYQEIKDKIEHMINTGLISHGGKAPSLREMSSLSGMSVTTIMKAYLELEMEGILFAKPQSGFFVSEIINKSEIPDTTSPATEPVSVNKFDMISEVIDVMSKPDVFPLGGALPSTELLPSKELARLSRKIISERPEHLVYEEIRGSEDLRRQIAFYMTNIGVKTTHDDIIITNGAMEALFITLASLASRGDAVIVESPCFFGYLQTLETLGIYAIEVDTNPQTGVDLQKLQDTLGKFNVKAVLLQPNFNNPLGCLMPEENKKKTVDICRKAGVPIIEDDLFGDVSYSGRRPVSLRQYDNGETVIYLSAFSKTLAPGYRVGWLMPGNRFTSMLKLKVSISLNSARLPQLVLSEYLSSGRYARHVRKFTASCKSQISAFSCSVTRHFPEGTKITQPEGGMLLWVEMPEKVDSGLLYKTALKKNIGIAPGNIFTAQNRYNNCMRINCGHPWSEKLEKTVSLLGDMAKKQL